MSEVSVTVRIPENLRDRLQALSLETSRSKSFLTVEAIQHYVETEEENLAGIKQGLADIEAGRVVPHREAMRQIRATIDRMASTKKSA